MASIRAFLIAGILITIVLIPGQSQSVNDSGIELIPEDGYFALPFEVKGAILLRYQVTVLGGGEVDVFIMSPENFQRYASWQPFSYQESSSMGVMDVSKEFMLLPEDYYFVIDNTERGQGNISGSAEVSYELRHLSPVGPLLEMLVPLALIMAAIVVLIIILLLMIRRDEKSGGPGRVSGRK